MKIELCCKQGLELYTDFDAQHYGVYELRCKSCGAVVTTMRWNSSERLYLITDSLEPQSQPENPRRIKS